MVFFSSIIYCICFCFVHIYDNIWSIMISPIMKKTITMNILCVPLWPYLFFHHFVLSITKLQENHIHFSLNEIVLLTPLPIYNQHNVYFITQFCCETVKVILFYLGMCLLISIHLFFYQFYLLVYLYESTTSYRLWTFI